MRAVVQRVRKADVKVEGGVRGEIGNGLLVFIGIEEADTESDSSWLARKIAALRIFDDAEGVMNVSCIDADGEVLVVSQFTLHASYKRGARPYYGRSALPEKAVPLYLHFVRAIGELVGRPVPTGEFGAAMEVSLVNDGPVTIILDSKTPE
jgi:D-tyrosyl-tRNA(Tyr) deacylase